MKLSLQATVSALLACAALPAAQETREFPSGSIVLRTEAPAEIQYHRYRVSDGTLERMPSPPAHARGAVSCYDNTITPGSSSHPIRTQEMVDWGMKNCGASTYVESFTFGYRTDTRTSNMSVAFYAGTLGWNTLGNEVRRFTFTGFPGGFNSVHFITVDLSADPMILPDGPIGYGFTNDDGSAGAGTILAFAPSTSLGTYDALDVFDNPPAPSGIYTGTFNFGPGTRIGSIYMSINEADASVLASVQIRNGNGSNPYIFRPTSESMLGTTWNATFDLSGFTGAKSTVVAISSAAAPAASFSFGELLIDPAFLLTTDVANGNHSIALPNALHLVGTTLYTQGLVVAGGLHATNAIDVTLGF